MMERLFFSVVKALRQESEPNAFIDLLVIIQLQIKNLSLVLQII